MSENFSFANIELIHESSSEEPYFVICKDRNVPSAPLSIEDDTAFTQLLKAFPDLQNVHGRKEIEHGLLHRIDNETQGLILVASKQEFYDYMQAEQKEDRFLKHYTALCDFTSRIPDEQFPDFPESIKTILEKIAVLYKNNSAREKITPVEFTVTSQFRPYGKESTVVRPVNEYSGKAALTKASPKIYETKIKVTDIVEYDNKKLLKVHCTITNGYRHQVRCHLSWLGLPVYNDELYNPFYQPDFPFMMQLTGTTESLPQKHICFTADSFEFKYNGIKKEYSIKPDFE